MSDTELLTSDTEHGAAAATDPSAANGAPRRRGGLSGMVLADLRELAAQLGVADTAGMRKNDLITVIKERQGGASKPAARRAQPRPAQLALGDSAPAIEAAPVRPQPGGTEPAVADSAPRAERSATPTDEPATREPATRTDEPATREPATRTDESATRTDEPGAARTDDGTDTERRRRRRRPAGADDDGAPEQPGQGGAIDGRTGEGRTGEGRSEGPQRTRDGGRDGQRQRNQRDGQQGRDQQGRDQQGQGQGRDQQGRDQQGRDQQGRDQQGQGRDQQNRDQQGRRGNSNNSNNSNNSAPIDDEDDENGRRRGRRFRDRRRGRGERRPEGSEPEVREDDVLLPVAGILDVLENYAFVRTSGYLSGSNDVYVSLSLVRKYNLRRGDAMTGAVRQPRDGEQQRQKFNPLVRVDTVNGQPAEQNNKQRPEFTKLTPLYPNERLRLETEPHILTTRVIDLVMPVGKGQRALIVSPPKAGKTSVLQAIANAISTNNPECHLMVVLVDERPEEVTDMQRSVKGEVIASTFDRPPADHCSIAELSIERAKRLVEMGHDVVVLLDSITRLGRAYNLSAPASGRILSGGVDSTALYPPKRFLGAARNIEGGGSLTIFATALVETGSTGDTVIFEEFKGTGNAELKLDRKIADKRMFPAVDVDPSSTRKEELLLPPDELAVIHKLRRVLHALDSAQAIDLLLTQLRKTRTNIEFLMQVAKSTPGGGDD